MKINSLLGLLVAASQLFPLNRAAAQSTVPSPLGPYGSVKSYCGTNPIPQDGTVIPWIGCFSLSPGHSATGKFSEQQVEVAVDASGKEVFTVNGTLVTTSYDSQTRGRKTNLPYLRADSVDGYSVCTDAGAVNCPSHINVFSRNADKSVLFTVAECFPPQYRTCVLTQESWDFAKSHEVSKPTPPANTPMPEGPFASWPAESREPALQTLRRTCMLTAVMAFGGKPPQVPREILVDAMFAMVSGCVAYSMPDDWPGRASELERETSYEEKIKDTWPPDLDLDNMAKAMANRLRRH